jgi:hypothetical protein
VNTDWGGGFQGTVYGMCGLADQARRSERGKQLQPDGRHLHAKQAEQARRGSCRRRK